MASSSSSRVAPWLFRLSAILWVIWGGVHILGGVMTLRFIGNGQTAEAFHGILAALDLASLQITYPDGIAAILQQHGFNLAWFGLVTLVAAPFVWRRIPAAVYVAALVGGLADMGYFLFIDLGGYALPPGPQMTYICAAAILLSFAALYMTRTGRSASIPTSTGLA
ncbi:MAG: hypothetical protein Rubg2KO_25090 [Rubricoccaceae bacterium]